VSFVVGSFSSSQQFVSAFFCRTPPHSAAKFRGLQGPAVDFQRFSADFWLYSKKSMG
jgi:hypothetical protein